MVKRFPIFSTVPLLLFVSLCREGSAEVDRGCYTDDGEFDGGYEIVVPRKVNSDGKFLSHQIPQHFKRSFYKDQTKTDTIPDDVLHYRLQIEDEEHHLELRPNHRLVGPGAVVEVHRSRTGRNADDKDFLDNVKLNRMRDAQCHYHGRIRNQSGKSALSTCYGLTGYIRTKRSWYTIEPMPGHDFTKEAEHPHILYKRRPNEFGTDGELLCNVTDNMAKTIAKRAFNPQKRLTPKKGVKWYTLELLLVLDKTFLDYHRTFDVENYALTLLNMAAGLLRDVSLGVSIELTLVRMIKMEADDDQLTLATNRDLDRTLKHFEEWQQAINPGDDSHPNHHDCAILIAKTDICVSPNLCGFTGSSTIAGTCDPLKAAAIVKDLGLQTGYHIAHHIGHTLGMSHDVEEDNGCPGLIRRGKDYLETTVMHPGTSYVTKKWSNCSKSYLKFYIDAGLGFCLEDEPHDHNLPSTDLLPGMMYNGDDQCRLQYRQDARQCDLGISCETLRCAVPGKGCVSARKPPAEGSPCGERRWCYEMKCLMIGERPRAIDGGWGCWSPWSPCSRSCGSGVAFSVRRCSSPSPANGGAYCRGDRKRHKICATNPCETGAPSFRDVQCAEFNDWIFPEDGKVHRWTAYDLPENLRASENPCALYCLTETGLVASLRPKVTDGTTCYRGIRDICVDGVCREIPCDLNMESKAVEDVCGVCKGDSTSCKVKEGAKTFQVETRPKKVLNVPAGSRNVRVEETVPTKSRIIVQTKDGKSLIDGNRLGMFDVPGSKAWLGMIRARQEALNIPGTVTEDLIILVLPKENVTLKYSLGLKEKRPRKPSFSWRYVDWEKCSANCGPGEQISEPRCVEKIGGLVDERFCRRGAKPELQVRPCYQAPCLPRWLIGDWQGCTSCVSGCEKSRAVKCVRPVGHSEQDVDIIADSYCQGPKPKERESCTGRRRRDSLTPRGKKNNNFVAVPAISRDLRSKRSRDTIGRRENQKGRSPLPANGRLSGDGSDYEEDLKDGVKVKDEGKASRDRFSIGKRSASSRGGRVPTKMRAVKKGERVVDKEDIKNLTLTIILERDEENNVVNFPKNFKPQPPGNCTDFTLVGMDAVRYVQKIEEGRIAKPRFF